MARGEGAVILCVYTQNYFVFARRGIRTGNVWIGNPVRDPSHLHGDYMHGIPWVRAHASNLFIFGKEICRIFGCGVYEIVQKEYV